MKALFAFLLLFSFSSAFGVQRKIPISTSDGVVQITNGSTVPMTYTIRCFDRSTGTAIVTDTVTLSPKADKTYEGGADICAAGVTLHKKVGTGSAVLCNTSGNISYANRANACGSNAHVCEMTEVTDFSNLTTKGDENYAYAPPTGSWERSDCKGGYVVVADGTATYKPTTYYSTNTCVEIRIGGNVIPKSSASWDGKNGTNYPGAVCCPNNAGFSSCEVEVSGSNDPNGFLQSPQYKGGKAF